MRCEKSFRNITYAKSTYEKTIKSTIFQTDFEFFENILMIQFAKSTDSLENRRDCSAHCNYNNAEHIKSANTAAFSFEIEIGKARTFKYSVNPRIRRPAALANRARTKKKYIMAKQCTALTVRLVHVARRRFTQLSLIARIPKNWSKWTAAVHISRPSTSTLRENRTHNDRPSAASSPPHPSPPPRRRRFGAVAVLARVPNICVSRLWYLRTPLSTLLSCDLRCVVAVIGASA